MPRIPRSSPNLELLLPADGQLRLIDKSFEQQVKENTEVECLGKTFASDEARRDHYLDLLREKLKGPAFRQIEGFPIGEDEDILRLSDPPYYTACPNPWLADFVLAYGKPYDAATDRYHREPLAVDSSEGKTDPLYTAHSYHTKVPHQAIMRAILHYTEPGDLVLDGFAGSGMTGVAAQLCANPNRELREKIEAERLAAGLTPPVWGARRAILNDLGPAATFIAANYNLPFDVDTFDREARRILAEVDRELGWMYETIRTDGTIGRINFTVWSQIFACPNCGGEINFLREALDPTTKRVNEEFYCPSCDKELSKDNLQRVFDTTIDSATGESCQRVRFAPARINYRVGETVYEKAVDAADVALVERIDRLSAPPVVPTTTFPIKTMYHGSRLAPKGFTQVHHLYLSRPAQALGALWAKAREVKDQGIQHALLYFIEQAMWTMSRLNSYRLAGYSQVSQYFKGIYYVPAQHAECSVRYVLGGKLDRLKTAFGSIGFAPNNAILSTGTADNLFVPSATVDYVFTDPPFGENIYYADLNFLVESWHRVWTNSQPEAIVDQAKHKKLADYQKLMQNCFAEYHRVLKPGRWMTVVFHNSMNSVWNAIQEAMLAAGFVVADVRTLDKQQGSYRQVTSTAVKQDLVISAYKPTIELEQRFRLDAGTEEGAWDFVLSHLRQVPVFVGKANGPVQVVAERQGYLLFDRMVAFHVQRGASVPLSAGEFYAGLKDRFPERDGMFFLPEQVVEYDAKRMQASEVEQLSLIVIDEDSARKWVRQQTLESPQTYQELSPKFMRENVGWSKHETALELKEILDGVCLDYDGTGPIPDQIWTWLEGRADLRGTVKGADRNAPNAALRGEAKDRWYVPDASKAADLEKIRERGLLREFEAYRASTARKLKVVRLEAVRAGFKKAWGDRDYATIIKVAEKIDDRIVEEDPKLLMWLDQAKTRLGE